MNVVSSSLTQVISTWAIKIDIQFDKNYCWRFFRKDFLLPQITQRARWFKKVQAKKLVKSNKSKKYLREIAFLAVLNFFPVQILIFGHFWNCKKWNLAKYFSWNWFIWFHEFFWPGLFQICWPTLCCIY